MKKHIIRSLFLVIAMAFLSSCAHFLDERDTLAEIAVARKWSITPTNEQIFIEGVRLGKSLGSAQCDARETEKPQAMDMRAEIASEKSATMGLTPASSIRSSHVSGENADQLPNAPALLLNFISRPQADISAVRANSQVIQAQTNTGKGLLKELFPNAAFNGKTAELILEREIYFDNAADLARSLQAQLGIFVEATDAGLVFSDLKEIVYNTGFFTDEMASDIKNILSHPASMVHINKSAKTITLIDDAKGHGNITKEIAARQEKYRQYRYAIELQEGTKNISTAAGEISSAFPVQFAPDGGISLAPGGNKVLVTVVYPKYPDRLQGIIDMKGGVLESSRDGFKLRITLTGARE